MQTLLNPTIAVIARVVHDAAIVVAAYGKPK